MLSTECKNAIPTIPPPPPITPAVNTAPPSPVPTR